MSTDVANIPAPLSAPTETATFKRAQPGAPPWLWIWAGLFLVNLPSLFDQWRASFDQLSMLRSSTVQLQATSRALGINSDYGQLDFLLYPAVLIDFLPSAALLLGLALVLFPQARAFYIRRRFRLEPLPRTMPVIGPKLGEIESFIHAHAPNLHVTGNFSRMDMLAFVYPENHREVSIAIFGPLIQLWSTDQRAAEAVLLHEIAHYRRGDVRIVGVGSFFESVVKYGFSAIVLLLVVPTLVLHIYNLLLANSDFAEIGIPAQNVWDYQLGLAKVQAEKLIAITGGQIFWFAAALVAPLAAIWSAEFNADRYAADRVGSSSGIDSAIARGYGRVSRWRWILSRLSHPPASLRRWMLQRQLPVPVVLAWLTLLFPFSYAVRLAFLHLWATSSYFVIDFPAAEIWHNSVDNTVTYVQSMSGEWLTMATIVFLWPLVARLWETFMAGDRHREAAGSIRFYWSLAGAMFALGLLSLLLN